MPKAIEARTYEDAVAWLREHGFDVTEAPGTNGRVFLRKYNISAAIQKTAEDTEDGGSCQRRPPEGAAVFYRRVERGPRLAQPLQRIAGYGERVLPLRS